MIKPGASGLQFQRSNRSATLPPFEKNEQKKTEQVIVNKKKTKGKLAEANVVIALSVKQLTTPLATWMIHEQNER